MSKNGIRGIPKERVDTTRIALDQRDIIVIGFEETQEKKIQEPFVL